MARASWAGGDWCRLQRTRTSLAPLLLLKALAVASPRQAGVPGQAAANENRLLSLSCNYFIRLRHVLGRAGRKPEPWPQSLTLRLACDCQGDAAVGRAGTHRGSDARKGLWAGFGGLAGGP